MLQKPKTKFGYAHRILALPIVFIIAFAYLVNAKNKEIAETNKELKQDTVKKTVTATLVQLKDGVNPSLKEAKDAPENALFIIGAKEVSKSEYLDFVKNNITKNMVTSYSTPTKDEKLRVFGEREKYGVYRAELMSEQGSNADEYHKLIEKYNPDWYKNVILKNKIEAEQNEKKKYSEIYKRDIAEAKRNVEQGARDAAKAHIVVLEAQKDAVRAAKEATEAQKETEAAMKEMNSPKFKKMMKEAERESIIAEKEARKIAKERANIAVQRAELARQQAELIKQEIELNKKDPNRQNAPWIIGVGAHSTASNQYVASSTFFPDINYSESGKIDKIVIGTPDGKSNTYTFSNPNDIENLKIYVNGKEISRDEMKKIAPNDIKSINVIKKNEGSPKKNTEIRINLKD